jgi:DNA-binding transcriptional LysR family regulator
LSRTINSFSLHDFEVLQAVALHRGFRGAARHLNLPPSSISHIVGVIERRLGVLLFRRTTRSVSLTDAGQDFLERLGPALTNLSGVIESVNQFRDAPNGRIRLNASEHAAERALPMVLAFMKRFPEVAVDIVTEGRLIDIVANGFDAGLRLAEAVPQDMIAVSLDIAEAFIIVGAPAYLDKAGYPRTPADLLAHDCITSRLPSGAPLRWEVEAKGEQDWIDVAGRLSVGTTKLALLAVLDGMGIAYVMASLAQPYLDDGRLIQLLPDRTPPFDGVCLYYPKQRHASAAFRAFVEHFRDHRLRGV